MDRFARSTFIKVLTPGRRYKFVWILVVRSCSNDAYSETYEKNGDHSFFCEDETCRDERETVDLICEKDEKFTITSQLSFTKGTSMLPWRGKLQQHDY